MNIAFDIDGTMIHMHHIVDRFQRFGDEIFIVTTREPEDNVEVFEWADDLQIKRENIHFTNHQLKLDTLHKLNINLHFDDDPIEVDEINSNSETCKALLVNFKYNYKNG